LEFEAGTLGMRRIAFGPLKSFFFKDYARQIVTEQMDSVFNGAIKRFNEESVVVEPPVDYLRLFTAAFVMFFVEVLIGIIRIHALAENVAPDDIQQQQ